VACAISLIVTGWSRFSYAAQYISTRSA